MYCSVNGRCIYFMCMIDMPIDDTLSRQYGDHLKDVVEQDRIAAKVLAWGYPSMRPTRSSKIVQVAQLGTYLAQPYRSTQRYRGSLGSIECTKAETGCGSRQRASLCIGYLD